MSNNIEIWVLIMNNKNIKFYIISGFIFVACVLFGFTITRIINSPKENSLSSASNGEENERIQQSIKDEECEDTIAHTPEGKNMSSEIKSASAPDISQQKLNQDPSPKPRITNEQLTAIINNEHNQNYPRNVSLKYTNLDVENGEENLTSISLIRQYIKTGIWKRVIVTDATYDNSNNVSSITMTIIR